jgi:hypothetical protein
MLAHVQLIRTLPTSAIGPTFSFFSSFSINQGVCLTVLIVDRKESMSFHVPLFGPLVRVCVHVSVSSSFLKIILVFLVVHYI